MVSVAFEVDLNEETLCIDFGKIHSYFKRGQMLTSEHASTVFMDQTICIWERHLARLKLTKQYKLWNKTFENNRYMYRDLKLKFSVIDNHANTLHIQRVVHYFLNLLCSTMKKQFIYHSIETSPIKIRCVLF